jgi:hypothetical protein
LQTKFEHSKKNYNSITGLKTLMRKGKPDLAPLLELHPIESENSRVLIRLSGNNMKTKGK